jgi:predicted signal transduction protein with EAL and GGDEF domain
MGVIAEGVETLAQRMRLQDLGCERAQGYLISQPLSAETVVETIAAGGLVTVEDVESARRGVEARRTARSANRHVRRELNQASLRSAPPMCVTS